MISIERAIDVLEAYSEHVAEINIDGIMAYKMAIDALEKQIPKKVKVSQWNGICGVPYKNCPTCDTLARGSKFDKEIRHCNHCGQNLEWD